MSVASADLMRVLIAFISLVVGCVLFIKGIFASRVRDSVTVQAIFSPKAVTLSPKQYRLWAIVEFILGAVLISVTIFSFAAPMLVGYLCGFAIFLLIIGQVIYFVK